MPRHCIIEFNNPVTGQRHPSLLGYLLNQQGVDVDTVSEFLEQAYADISPLTKSWGNNNFNSDFVEPRLSDLTSLFEQPIVQDNKSYYRGQIEEPTIDKDGNLILIGREDELYKRAGLKSYGVSMTDKLDSAI